MARDRNPATVLITDAPEDPEKELRRREIRYVAMMLLRAACLIGAAILASARPPLWGVWVVICLVAMVLLPWFAVLLANDAPVRKRRPAPTVADSTEVEPSARPALPAPRPHRVIDADL